MTPGGVEVATHLVKVESRFKLPVGSPWAQCVIAGIVIVCLLAWLNAMFIWFPFEPMGFLNGMSYNPLISGMWTSSLVAWILKTVTLRVGGSKSDE